MRWLTIEYIVLGICIALTGFVFFAYSVKAAIPVSPIISGGTGTSTLPAYGNVLLGGKNGEYEFVATSTFGGGSAPVQSVFSRTGAITAQSGDYTTSLVTEGSNLYYTLARWAAAFAGTTTNALTEGSNNLYFTNARSDSRFITDLAATTSVKSITALPSLSLPYAQLTGAPTALSQFTNDVGFLLSSAFNSLFDNRLSATTSLPNITTLAGLSLPLTQTTGTLAVNRGGTGSTTLTGILKGAGTSAVTTAVGDTDYQKPISLTTTGSSGAATFSGDTLNIPNYAGGVTSVFGRSGAVTAQSGDYTTSQVTEGTNLYYTSARSLVDFITNLTATTSVKSIATLPSLSLPYSQLTGTPTIIPYAFPGGATSSLVTFNGGLTAANNVTLSGITGSTQCLHVSSTGLISGTGTDCGSSGGSVTAVSATYPIQSSGGTAPVISIAFGTTTSNIWAGTQTFSNPLVDGTLSGLIGGNSGTTYAVSTSSLNASITGNANTATTLATPRTINGVNFDGSAPIIITAASSSLLSDFNTFAHALTASITGNAGTATTLATGRTFSITGDLVYTSPTFDGSGNVTAAGTLATVNGNVGSFTNANITVNAKGLITAASNGTGGGGTGVGTIATSTGSDAYQRIPFYNSTSGYPALLASDPSFFFSTTSGVATLNVGKPAGTFDLGKLALAYQGSVTDNTVTLAPINGVSGAKTINVPALNGTLAISANGGVSEDSNGNLTNSGVTSIVAGTNVTISGATGAVTINSSGGSTGSSTLLSDVNTFSNQNKFTAQTTFSSLFATIASSTFATTTNLAVTGSMTYPGSFDNNLVGVNTSGFASPIGAGPCSAGSFLTTINGTGATCNPLTFTFPLSSSGSTVSFGGLSTSTAAVQGNLPYFSGANTFANVATTSVTCTGSAICTPFTVIGSSPIAINAANQTVTLSGAVTGSGPTAITTAFGSAAANSLLINATGAAAVPTFISTSSLFAAVANGKVLATVNGTYQFVATSTDSCSSGVACSYAAGTNSFTNTGVTSIVAGTNVTISGSTGAVTVNATGGGSGQKVFTWVVAASGGDFTTIQAALNQCGTSGGGNIILTDATYAQGSTGLLWKGSNCAIWGRGPGTTTITFTGATTLFKTNTPSSGFTHNEIHNVVISGDGNASGVAIDASDMDHGIYDDVQTGGVGTTIRLNDTQNVTFYNSFTNIDANDNRAFCINASSTKPTNANYFHNIFCGAPSGGGVGINMDNGNGNHFDNIFLEPASVTGTKGIVIFDNKLATNGGVWNNTFENFYIEANGTGIQMSADVGDAAGNGIKRNTFTNIINESNTTDYSLAQSNVAQNTFINAMDSNFTNALTTFNGPFGIGTSTELLSLSATPFAYFGISADNSVSTNEFVVANSSNRTDFSINNSGNGIFNNTLSVLGHFITVISAAFTPATNGEIGIDTTDNQLKYESNSAVRVLSPYVNLSFTVGSSTWGAGTTTSNQVIAPFAGTAQDIQCKTDTGTMNVQLLVNATKALPMLNASTTVGTVTFASSNTFSRGDILELDMGTVASSPTINRCTIRNTQSAT